MLSSRKNEGFVLIVALWIAVVLSLLAIGLGRAVSQQTRLTTYAVAKMQARYNSWAGFLYSVTQLAQAKKAATEDNQENTSKPMKIAATENLSWDNGPIHIEYAAEEGRLNLNALTRENYSILTNLIVSLGHEESVAKTIAASLIDWVDEDKDVFLPPFGAEDDFYQSLPQGYSAKNAPLVNVEELLLVHGMTQQIFDQLKPFVTVFPAQGRLGINLEQASTEVLLAMAQTYIGAQTNTSLDDARSLVQKIIEFRGGADGFAGTPDDQMVEEAGLALNAKEEVIYRQFSNLRVVSPRYWRIRVTTQDKDQLTHCAVQAVVLLDDLSTLYWHRE